jgi:hypothetical protein
MTGGWMAANSSMFNLNLGLHNKSRQHFKKAIAGKHFKEYQASAKTFQQRNKLVQEKALNTIKEQGYLNTFIEQLKKQYFRLFNYQSFFSQQFQGDKQRNFVNKYHIRHNNLLVKVILGFNTLFYMTIMIAMILGLIVSFKKSIIAQQFAVFLLYFFGLFFLLHTIPRFRIVLIPLMGFYSGYLYFYCFHKKTTENISVLSVNRNKLVVLIVTTLVFLLSFSSSILDKYFPI